MKVENLMLIDIKDRMIYINKTNENDKWNIKGYTKGLNVQVHNETLSISPNNAFPTEINTNNSKSSSILEETFITLPKNIQIFAIDCLSLIITQRKKKK